MDGQCTDVLPWTVSRPSSLGGILILGDSQLELTPQKNCPNATRREGAKTSSEPRRSNDPKLDNVHPGRRTKCFELPSDMQPSQTARFDVRARAWKSETSGEIDDKMFRLSSEERLAKFS